MSNNSKRNKNIVRQKRKTINMGKQQQRKDHITDNYLLLQDSFQVYNGFCSSEFAVIHLFHGQFRVVNHQTFMKL